MDCSRVEMMEEVELLCEVAKCDISELNFLGLEGVGNDGDEALGQTNLE